MAIDVSICTRVYWQDSTGGGSPPLTSLKHTTDIGDLISDAMEDAPSTHTHSTHTPKRSGRKRRSHKTSSASPRMDVRIETDKSVVVDFCSDSSDDEEDCVGSECVKSEGGGRVRGPHPILSASGQSSIFSGSDDDFCFVDTPTSTRVVPDYCIVYCVFLSN